MAFEVTTIAYYYKYSIEYILRHDFAWRRLLLRRFLYEDAKTRSWELHNTSLSHTPATENDATKLNSAFRETLQKIRKQEKFALGRISFEEFLGITDGEDEDDGVMRYVD